MLTEKQISEWAENEYKYGYSSEEETAAINGANWANEQNAAELAALRAENEKLREALQDVWNDCEEATNKGLAATFDAIRIQTFEKIKVLRKNPNR